jgi:Rrf2 family protein
MKISKKGEYALKALINLAINYDRGIGVTLINDISEAENIPPKYLEHILLNLKKAGILVSKRGVGGGYTLARSPADITLGEILRMVEGPLAPVNCVSKSAHVNCPQEKYCGLYCVMLDVRNAISDIVDNISLKDVAKRTTDLIEKKEGVYNYCI